MLGYTFVCLLALGISCGYHLEKLDTGCQEGYISVEECCKQMPSLELLKHPYECDKYYMCVGKEAKLYQCPEGHVFSDKKCIESDAACLGDSDAKRHIVTSKQCREGKRDAKSCCKGLAIWAVAFLKNPTDCHTYYYCRYQKPVLQRCPWNFHWNVKHGLCLLPQLAKCSIDVSTTVQPTTESVETTTEDVTPTGDLTTTPEEQTTTAEDLTTTPEALTTAPEEVTTPEEPNSTPEAETTTPEDPITTSEAPTTIPEEVTPSEDPTTTSEAQTTTAEDVTTPEAPTRNPEEVTTSEDPTTTSEAQTTTAEDLTTTPEAQTTATEDVTTPEDLTTITEELTTPQVTTPEEVTSSEDPTTNSEAQTTTPEDLTTTPEAQTTATEDVTTPEDLTTISEEITTPEVQTEATTSASFVDEDCLWGTVSAEECCEGVPFWIDVLLRNPDDCGTFFQCVHEVPMLRYCPSGLHWNVNANSCDWPIVSNCEIFL